MIRPESAPIYDQIDLKLGIKSSLPAVKPTLALLFLMWREMGKPSELEYSDAQGNSIVLRQDIEETLYHKLQELTDGITLEQFRDKVNNNLMLKAQLEALLVAFELVWKVAKIRFSDGRSNSAERTGGSRFPKKVWFTLNMDLLDAVCGDDAEYLKVLFAWLGFDLNVDSETENTIIRFLTAISETAYYKLVDGESDVVFNLETVYKAVLSNTEPVDVSGDKEAKGPLRILKSALSENLFAFLAARNNGVTAINPDALREYSARVSTFHQLNPKMYQLVDTPDEELNGENNEESFKTWLSGITKANGEPYSENTRNQYISALKAVGVTFAESIAPFTSIFEITDVTTFERAESAIKSDAGYEEFNRNRGNGSLSAGLDLYKRFLDEREDHCTTTHGIRYRTNYSSTFARNRILFGAPGTGKSYTLNGDRKELLYGDRTVDEDSIDCSDFGEYERVTFHPDYSYANFVGTYKPVPCKDDQGHDAITYAYVPGPFMRTYVKALQNSRTDAPKPFLLVIEEINRANVAAVFGDVFQLLDRGDDEVSEYPIQASEDIKKYLAGELGGNPDDYSEIRIPDNMFIWATMNSADQGVFPMDTAFKRRWDFTYLGIDDSEAGIVGKKVVLGQGEYLRVVEWNALRKAINSELLTYKVNEDKLMGPYFISKKNLPEGDTIDPAVFTRIFKNKVLMYLFDDAAKQKRPSLFAGCKDENKNLYSQICREFDTKGVFIFCTKISDSFLPEDDGE